MMIHGMQCSCRNNKNTRSSFEIAEFLHGQQNGAHMKMECVMSSRYLFAEWTAGWMFLDVFGAAGMYIGEQTDAKKMRAARRKAKKESQAAEPVAE